MKSIEDGKERIKARKQKEKVRLLESKIQRLRESDEPVSVQLHRKLEINRKRLDKQILFKCNAKHSKDHYTFLQYQPLIYLWAINTKKIVRGDLELLIYLHPVTVFPKSELVKAQRLHGRNNPKLVNRLISGGWVKEFSREKVKGGTYNIYYSFTYKATSLIMRIYSMLLLEEPLSMDHQSNGLISRTESKQDQKVLENLMEFNRRVREKAKNKT